MLRFLVTSWIQKWCGNAGFFFYFLLFFLKKCCTHAHVVYNRHGRALLLWEVRRNHYALIKRPQNKDLGQCFHCFFFSLKQRTVFINANSYCGRYFVAQVHIERSNRTDEINLTPPKTFLASVKTSCIEHFVQRCQVGHFMASKFCCNSKFPPI